MLEIPIYKNTKDGTHCFQACLKSVLKFYFPKKAYSFKSLDRLTGHKKGKWTWDTKALIFLSKIGFEVIYISNFDYRKFAKLGEEYLRKHWTDEVYQVQKKFSDFRNEQHLAKKLIKEKKVKLKKRPGTLKDIKTLFAQGYIILAPINPYVLDRKKGYTSHLVIITDIKKDTIFFNDPGLPPQKNRKAKIKVFLRAMGYPSQRSISLIALKFKGK